MAITKLHYFLFSELGRMKNSNPVNIYRTLSIFPRYSFFLSHIQSYSKSYENSSIFIIMFSRGMLQTFPPNPFFPLGLFTSTEYNNDIEPKIAFRNKLCSMGFSGESERSWKDFYRHAENFRCKFPSKCSDEILKVTSPTQLCLHSLSPDDDKINM